MSEELIGGDSLYNPEYRAAQQRLRARSEEAVRRAEEAAEEPLPEVTVVVVDDQDLVRNGFRLILSSYENLRVVGEARNGLEVQDVVARTHPDVVLMDIRMPLRGNCFLGQRPPTPRCSCLPRSTSTSTSTMRWALGLRASC